MMGIVDYDCGNLRSLENALDACLQDAGKKDHTIAFGVGRDGEDIRFTIEDDGVAVCF